MLRSSQSYILVLGIILFFAIPFGLVKCGFGIEKWQHLNVLSNTMGLTSVFALIEIIKNFLGRSRTRTVDGLWTPQQR